MKILRGFYCGAGRLIGLTLCGLAPWGLPIPSGLPPGLTTVGRALRSGAGLSTFCGARRAPGRACLGGVGVSCTEMLSGVPAGNSCIIPGNSLDTPKLGTAAVNTNKTATPQEKTILSRYDDFTMVAIRLNIPGTKILS